MSSREKRARELAKGTPSPALSKPARTPATPAIDSRPEATALFENLKVSKKMLSLLLKKCSGEWTYFDPLYRFYHQSFKVFGLRHSLHLRLPAKRDGYFECVLLSA